MDLDDVRTGGGGDRKPSVGDLAQVYKFPEKKWVTIRLLKGMAAEAGYWVKVSKKDGKSTKFYAPCPSFDPVTQQRDSTRPDPWRDLQQAEQSAEVSREDQLVQFASHFWINAIIRSEQKKQPSKMPKPTKAELKSGFKDKDSDSWTPVGAVKMGKSFAGKVKELKSLNSVESKKTGAVKSFSVNDVEYGRDIRVYYDPSKAPADQYQIQLGDKRTPLTEDEQAYLVWDLEAATTHEFDDKAIKADFDSWARRMKVKIDIDTDESDEDDDEDDDEKPKKKKGSKSLPPKKAGKKNAKVEDEEDEDEDSDSEDDDDDEPVSKKKSKSKSKDEDDEDDDFDDEDEEDEDEESDSDEDKDDEDDDDDDEPVSKKKSPKSKSKDEDDEDEDDEDDFDDEDEDADSDEDDEDEDEEEDEKPAKKSKKKSPPPAKSKKSKGKKKPVDEDDDF